MSYAEYHRQRGTQKDHHLKGVRPRHSLNATHIGVDQREKAHHRDAQEYVHTSHDIQGNGRQEEDDSHPTYLIEDE